MVYEEVLEVRKVASVRAHCQSLWLQRTAPFYQKKSKRAFYPILMRIAQRALVSSASWSRSVRSFVYQLNTLRAVTSHKVEAVKKARGLRFDSQLARMTGLPFYSFYSLNKRVCKYAILESIVKAINDL